MPETVKEASRDRDFPRTRGCVDSCEWCVRAAHVFLSTAKITRARLPRERKIRGAVPAKSAATFHITHTGLLRQFPCREFFLSLSLSLSLLDTGEPQLSLFRDRNPASVLIIKNKLRSTWFLSCETIIFSKKKKKMTRNREEISSIGNKFSLFLSFLSTN